MLYLSCASRISSHMLSFGNLKSQGVKKLLRLLVNLLICHLFPSFTAGFLCLLFCDELPQSDRYIRLSGDSEGEPIGILCYTLGTGLFISLSLFQAHTAIFIHLCLCPRLCPPAFSVQWYHCISNPWTDKETTSRDQIKISVWVLLLWHIHPHPADGRIQLHLRELLQNKIHQEGQ